MSKSYLILQIILTKIYCQQPLVILVPRSFNLSCQKRKKQLQKISRFNNKLNNNSYEKL